MGGLSVIRKYSRRSLLGCVLRKKVSQDSDALREGMMIVETVCIQMDEKPVDRRTRHTLERDPSRNSMPMCSTVIKSSARTAAGRG
jgi:hypothetical protein